MTPAQFRAAHKALGLTAEGLAREMRATRMAIYRWSTGKSVVSGLALTALEYVLIKHGLALSDFQNYRQCSECGEQFEVSPRVGRPDKAYCSDACRMRAYRKRKASNKNAL